MKTLIRRRSKQRLGATTVELAIMAPVFFLIVFAMFEFGRAVMVIQSLTDAARAGARKGALATTISTGDAESEAREFLGQTMTSSFDMNACTVSVSPGGLRDLESGAKVTATVEVAFADVTWISPSFMKNVVLRGTSSMTKE
jgi:Flp pilus assembly protein TadG